MSKYKLPKEEQELLDAAETGEFESVLTEDRRRELQAIAGNTFKKDKRINVRISNRDLMAIQSKAFQEWYPLSNSSFQYYSQIHFRFSERSHS